MGVQLLDVFFLIAVPDLRKLQYFHIHWNGGDIPFTFFQLEYCGIQCDSIHPSTPFGVFPKARKGFPKLVHDFLIQVVAVLCRMGVKGGDSIDQPFVFLDDIDKCALVVHENIIQTISV